VKDAMQTMKRLLFWTLVAFLAFVVIDRVLNAVGVW
jgi:hypothetical protein